MQKFQVLALHQVEFRKTSEYQRNKWKFERLSRKSSFVNYRWHPPNFQRSDAGQSVQVFTAGDARRGHLPMMLSSPPTQHTKLIHLVTGEFKVSIYCCSRCAGPWLRVVGLGYEWSLPAPSGPLRSELSSPARNGRPRVGVVVPGLEWSSHLHYEQTIEALGLHFSATELHDIKRWVLFSMNLICFNVFDRFFSFLF